jgi:hypothetical protein
MPDDNITDVKTPSTIDTFIFKTCCEKCMLYYNLRFTVTLISQILKLIVIKHNHVCLKAASQLHISLELTVLEHRLFGHKVSL